MLRRAIVSVLVLAITSCHVMEAASVHDVKAEERMLQLLASLQKLQTRGRFDSSSSSSSSTTGDASSSSSSTSVEDSVEVESSSDNSCDFETDVCSWTQDSSDDFEWSVGSSTPSGNTGPSVASSGSQFAYIEASTPRVEGEVARLESSMMSQVSSSGRCMGFTYNMYGSGSGHLRVYKTSGGGEEMIWHRDGNQGSEWQSATINLESDEEFQVIIEAAVGSNYMSDIAIDNLVFDESSCYAVPVHCGENRENRKRILGGEVSESGEWPWQIHVRTTIPGSSSFMQCGGTLISDQWIVSAAHCIEYDNVWITDTTQMRLYFGELNVNDWESSQFSVTPELIIVHPERTVQGVAPYDIILIKLPAPVTMSDTVNVACLPDTTDFFPAGTDCVVSGWGVQNYQGSTSEVLMHVDQELFDLQTCIQTFGTATMNEDMLCAGSVSEIETACSGDSGGPLVCKDGDYYTVLGVVSFGAPCGYYDSALPGVYASVQYFLSWIESTIQAN